MEISPRSFSVRVREGTRLNQLRLRDGAGARSAISDEALKLRHAAAALVDGPLDVRDGLVVHVGLAHPAGGVVGFRAIKNGSVIDVDRPRRLRTAGFLGADPRARAGGSFSTPTSSIFSPRASGCRCLPTSPPRWRPWTPRWASSACITPASSIPASARRCPGRRAREAVLEVRGRDVPFLLEDGQSIGRLVFEPLAAPADALYGAIGGSNYQGQGLKLSKHFRAWEEG